VAGRYVADGLMIGGAARANRQIAAYLGLARAAPESNVSYRNYSALVLKTLPPGAWHPSRRCAAAPRIHLPSAAVKPLSGDCGRC